MRSAALRPSALPLLAAALAGCGGYNSMFPRREDIFKPIPVNLGDVRVQGGDTSYVLGGRGYQVVVRDRELLPDAKTALDRLGLAWRQYFATDPAPVTVVVRAAPRRGNAAAADSAPATPNPGTTGVVVVNARRVDERDPRQADAPRVREGQLAMPVVRAWLVALASGGAPASPAPVTSVADTTARRDRSPFGRADDPRIPDWVESAVPALVAGAGDAEFLAVQLQKSHERLLPLRTLLTTARPVPAGDSARADARDDRDRDRDREGRLDGVAPGRGRPLGAYPGRGRQELGGARLFDAQALSLTEFVAQREGRAFVGRMVGAALAGRVEDALRETTTLPHDLDGLDRAWRSWLETEAANAAEGRRGR